MHRFPWQSWRASARIGTTSAAGSRILPSAAPSCSSGLSSLFLLTTRSSPSIVPLRLAAALYTTGSEAATFGAEQQVEQEAKELQSETAGVTTESQQLEQEITETEGDEQQSSQQEEKKQQRRRSQALKAAQLWEQGLYTKEQFAVELERILKRLEQYKKPQFLEVAMLVKQILHLPPELHNDMVQRSLALIERMGRAPQINYNRFVTSLSKGGHLKAALLVYKRMLDHKLFPENHLLTSLLLACVKSSHIDAAFRLFDGLSMQGVKPNVNNFNTLLQVCTDPERSRRVLEQMVTAGVQRDFHTYNILVNLATKRNDIDMVIRHYEELITERPDLADQASSLLAHVIRECGKVGRLDDAQRLFEATHARPNVVVLSSLVDAYVKSGNVDRACKLFRDMERMYEVQPNIVTYNALMRGFVEKEMLSSAIDLNKEMLAKGVAPNVATYNTLLRGAALEARVDIVRKLLDEMMTQNVKPNANSLTLLAAVYTGTKPSPETARSEEATVAADSSQPTEVPVEESKEKPSSKQNDDAIAALRTAVNVIVDLERYSGSRLDANGLQILFSACERYGDTQTLKRLAKRARFTTILRNDMQIQEQILRIINS